MHCNGHICGHAQIWPHPIEHILRKQNPSGKGALELCYHQCHNSSLACGNSHQTKAANLCARISKLKSTCNNRKYHPRVPASLLWLEIHFRGCGEQKLTCLLWEGAFQPWGCQPTAALLCNVYQLLAQGIWHLPEAQISHSARAATSSCLPLQKNLQAGFLSFLCVTSFSFYVRICFVLPRHTYLLSISLHYFIHLSWDSLWDFYS